MKLIFDKEGLIQFIERIPQQRFKLLSEGDLFELIDGSYYEYLGCHDAKYALKVVSDEVKHFLLRKNRNKGVKQSGTNMIESLIQAYAVVFSNDC